MAVCCHYVSNDGTDAGFVTYLGDTCPKLTGYSVTQTPGVCQNVIPPSPEVEELLSSRTEIALKQLDYDHKNRTLQTSDGRTSASIKIDRRHKMSGEKGDKNVNFIVPPGCKKQSFSSNIDARGSAGGSVNWANNDPHDGTIKIHAWADAFSYCEASVSNVQAVEE